MQMVAAAGDEAELRSALQQMESVLSRERTPAAERLRHASRLWCESPQAWTVLRAILAAIQTECTEPDAIRRWSRLFDQAVAISPEASVALYSLGRADLLERATAEIIDLMVERDLIGPDRLAVEIGCGIGRFMSPIARLGTFVFGLDVSIGMLAEARRRCRNEARALPIRTSGADLACIRDGSVDLVYAVDSFPYLVDAGVAAAHVTEAHRVLRPGGTLLVANWSYRGDPAADQDEVARLAGIFGFKVMEDGAHRFRHWDGRLFRLSVPCLPTLHAAG